MAAYEGLLNNNYYPGNLNVIEENDVPVENVPDDATSEDDRTEETGPEIEDSNTTFPDNNQSSVTKSGNNISKTTFSGSFGPGSNFSGTVVSGPAGSGAYYSKVTEPGKKITAKGALKYKFTRVIDEDYVPQNDKSTMVTAEAISDVSRVLKVVTTGRPNNNNQITRETSTTYSASSTGMRRAVPQNFQELRSQVQATFAAPSSISNLRCRNNIQTGPFPFIPNEIMPFQNVPLMTNQLYPINPMRMRIRRPAMVADRSMDIPETNTNRDFPDLLWDVPMDILTKNTFPQEEN